MTGRVMLEVGLAVAAPLIYFVIGSYYRLRHGLLLGILGIGLYLAGLTSGLPIFSRLTLMMLPFAVMMHRTKVTNETYPEGVNVCPVCGWRNDPGRTTCGAPRCDVELPDVSRFSQLSYYLPPKLVAWLIVAVVGLGILYDTTYIGRFIMTWIVIGWPLFALLALLLYITFRME